MSTPNDGGPAFPLESSNDHRYSPGMTLRDWFAGQALAGMLAHGDTELGVAASGRPIAHTKGAYAIADAMLAERSKKEVA